MKHEITHSPVLHPPNYSKVYMLYLVASTTTIGMVLMQEDQNGQEHVIYYLSKSLLDYETQNSHVENNGFGHGHSRSTLFSLHSASHDYCPCELQSHVLCSDLSLLGGKYSRWIVILQEFHLEFMK